MSVPDYVAPIVGYRIWQWDAPFLKSLSNGEPWFPGKPMTAKCCAGLAHEQPPQERCTCGIYAARETLDQLARRMRCIHGEVYLWGRVVEHTDGWRAQYAYPKTLTFPWARRAGSDMGALIAYGADIDMPRVQGGEGILLWSKQGGYSQYWEEVLQRTEALKLKAAFLSPPLSKWLT